MKFQDAPDGYLFYGYNSPGPAIFKIQRNQAVCIRNDGAQNQWWKIGYQEPYDRTDSFSTIIPVSSRDWCDVVLTGAY